jgi:protocatechuate 3,4-dioxygenase, beta subunit
MTPIGRPSRSRTRATDLAPSLLLTLTLFSLTSLHCARNGEAGSEQTRTAVQPAVDASRQQAPPVRTVGGSCDGCEAIYEGMPAQISSHEIIAPASEPGERLEISGTVFQKDGRTPAPGVILYLHQTDAKGYYTPAPNTTGLAARHGRLRGWVRTGERGEYRFETIRPASYPNTPIPQHIHVYIKEPDKNEYYIDDFTFDDDPLLVERERSRLEGRGGSGILKLTRRDGLLSGRRDIILGLKIPDYP